jgi:catechol 2,3-dioxygenase-like lactoylglutathione lyase family enzyme
MKLNQVTVGCSDLAQSVAFYRRLGLKLIVSSERYARFEVGDGSATFSLEVVGAVAPSTTTIYFECEDLDDRVASLERTGLSFDMGPTDMPWLWREARLSDPDGNRLCLYFAGENRRFPPWRLKE